MKRFSFERTKTPEQELEQVRKKIEALEKIISIAIEAQLIDDYLPQLFIRDVEDGLKFARDEQKRLESKQG